MKHQNDQLRSFRGIAVIVLAFLASSVSANAAPLTTKTDRFVPYANIEAAKANAQRELVQAQLMADRYTNMGQPEAALYWANRAEALDLTLETIETFMPLLITYTQIKLPEPVIISDPIWGIIGPTPKPTPAKIPAFAYRILR